MKGRTMIRPAGIASMVAVALLGTGPGTYIEIGQADSTAEPSQRRGPHSTGPCFLPGSNRPPKLPHREMRFDMKTPHQSIIANVAVCVLLIAATTTAKAQFGYKVTNGTKAGIVAVLVAVGVGAGIGIYFAVHHGHSLNGCAVSGAGGLELQSSGNQQTYALVGEVAGIKPGDHVRVSGKKTKNTGGPQQFVVEKLTKDYGACTAAP